MKRKNIFITCSTSAFFVFSAVFFLQSCTDTATTPAISQQEHAEHTDEHAGHDHFPIHAAEARQQPDNHDEHDHAGHDHGAAESEHEAAATAGRADEQAEAAGEEDDHAGEIEVTPEAMKMAGITVAKAGTGRIGSSINVSGEIGFNEDRIMRLNPRFPGIVKQCRFRIGEQVRAGDAAAVIESNESMATYVLKAPMSGRIIEKLAVPGEYVSEEKSIYVLADLSTVWVNLAVYSKDAARVRSGQKVSIVAVGSDAAVAGTVHYVTPVMDAQTRRITARVVLPNENNSWLPGSFVTARIEPAESAQGLVVDINAVQVLDGKNVVFVQHEPGSFKPVEVMTGENDSRRILILSGLKAGDVYVNNGAFELKAKIVTSTLGDHAGHNH